MFVIPPDLEEGTARLRRCAELHSMPVVFANFGGPSGGLPSGGGSAIWSEAGEPVAQLDTNGPGVAVAVEEPDGWHGSAVMVSE